MHGFLSKSRQRPYQTTDITLRNRLLIDEDHTGMMDPLLGPQPEQWRNRPPIISDKSQALSSGGLETDGIIFSKQDTAAPVPDRMDDYFAGAAAHTDSYRWRDVLIEKQL